MAKAKKKKNEVATKEDQALMEQFSGYGQDGFEDTSSDSYAVPFVRILQPNSPQLLEDDDAYIDGAKPGMFFNTLSGDLYGKKLQVINVHFMRDFIEWRPDRGGFVQSHGDNEDIKQRVVEVDGSDQIMDNGNLLQESRNHFILLPEGRLEEGPMIFALTSTGIRHSKRWMSLIRRLKSPDGKINNPLFMGVWDLSTALNETDEGKWYQIGTKSGGKYEFNRIISGEEFEAVKASRELILSGRAKVDYDAGETSGTESEASGKSSGEDDTPF